MSARGSAGWLIARPTGTVVASKWRMARALLTLLLGVLLAPSPAAAGDLVLVAEGFLVEMDPQTWRQVADGLPAYEEYRQQRLVMALRSGELIGPARLGFDRRAFRQNNASRFYIVVEGEAHYRLTYPDLIRITGDPLVTARHERFAAAAVRDQNAGATFFGIGVGFAIASLVAGSIAFDQGDFSWSPFLLPPLLSISGSFMAVGVGAREKARHTEEQLAEDYRLELILDRDEAWAAVELHNSRLRRELGLPDDERMDAPRRP